MNTALGTGDVPLSEGFVAWRAYVNKTPDLPCGKLMQRTCPHLDRRRGRSVRRALSGSRVESRRARLPEPRARPAGCAGRGDFAQGARLVDELLERRILHGDRGDRSRARAARHERLAQDHPQLPRALRARRRRAFPAGMGRGHRQRGAEEMEVTYADVAAAHERIKPFAKRTPVLTSSTVDALTGAKVHFKCENFQRMGAFKFRGAYNALSQLSSAAETQRRRRLFFGQPCAGGGAVGEAARRSRDHRHADRRAEGEARGNARLRRGSGHVRREQRGPAEDRGEAGRRARPDADSALRPPAHSRWPGHRGEGVDRGDGAARHPDGALRRRRTAFGLFHRGEALVAASAG